jgi:hypothetical protein
MSTNEGMINTGGTTVITGSAVGKGATVVIVEAPKDGKSGK